MEIIQLTTDHIIEIYCTPLSMHESYESYERKENTLWDWLGYVTAQAQAQWVDSVNNEALTAEQRNFLTTRKKKLNTILENHEVQSTEQIRSHTVYVMQEMERNGSDAVIDDKVFIEAFNTWLASYEQEAVQRMIDLYSMKPDAKTISPETQEQLETSNTPRNTDGEESS